MIVNAPYRMPAWPARPTGGFGFWAILAQLGAQVLGSETSKKSPTVQPAQLSVTTPGAPSGSSDTGLYIGLGIGAIAIAGLAFSILRSPTPKLSSYRQRRRR